MDKLLVTEEYFLENIVKQCKDFFNSNKIIQLGATFKPESDDIRTSTSLVIYNKLQKEGFEVYLVDPHVTVGSKIKLFNYEDIFNITENVIITTNHKIFLNYDLENKKVIRIEINRALIIPCKNEGKEIIPIINKFIEHTNEDTSIYIVLDSENDKTFSILNSKSLKINLLINNEGSGVASAINFGIKNSSGNYVCIAMGDGSDDPTQVEDLFNLVERGLSIAVASRYSRGGQYIGTKNLKYFF